MAITYVQIGSTVTVGAGGAASIDFTSIPSTYTDLCLKVSIRTAETQIYSSMFVKINNSSSGVVRLLQGSGSAASSNSDPTNMIDLFTGNSATASTFCNAELYFPNYAGSNNKAYSSDAVGENNASTSYLRIAAGLYSSSSAINRLTLVQQSGLNILQYSTAALYGIKSS